MSAKTYFFDKTFINCFVSASYRNASIFIIIIIIIIIKKGRKLKAGRQRLYPICRKTRAPQYRPVE